MHSTHPKLGLHLVLPGPGPGDCDHIPGKTKCKPNFGCVECIGGDCKAAHICNNDNKCQFHCTTPQHCRDHAEGGKQVALDYHDCKSDNTCGYKAVLQCEVFWYRDRPDLKPGVFDNGKDGPKA